MSGNEGKRINVLLVDDERDFLELAEKFFQKEKPEIDLDITTSAEDALEMLEENVYDVIVSDYDMPIMDGLDFLEAVRSEGVDIPFIFLTGQGEEEVAMKALNIGADKYHKKGKDIKSRFEDLADSMLQEALRDKSETELETFEKWIKSSLNSKPEEESDIF